MRLAKQTKKKKNADVDDDDEGRKKNSNSRFFSLGRTIIFEQFNVLFLDLT